ncbi:MAG: transcription termination/antitermination protein NusG [Planctomycetota bacterium]
MTEHDPQHDSPSATEAATDASNEHAPIEVPAEPSATPDEGAPSDTTPNAAADAPVETPSETPAKPVESAELSKDALDGRPDEKGDVISSDEPVRKEGMDWFVLRVASNKENSVRETLLRKIQIEQMQHLVDRILVPTEKTKTYKNGKQKITETKLYPGYVFVEMKLEDDGRIPQDVFFLIKETTGVGDFVGTAGRPTPMQEHEIEKMLRDSERPEEEPVIKFTFEQGEVVSIKEGPFQGYEGTVDELFPEKGIIRVLVTIFGRQAPVELEEWMVGKLDEE